MVRKILTAEWAKYTEEDTRTRKPKNIAEAKRTFLKKLSRDEQMALAEEIVSTRASELCRAYKNVVDVCFGYKRQSDAKSTKKRIVRTPCVTFIVKAKWRGRRDSDESLPTHLFAYWKIGRTRKLCAVPTDVEPASEFARIKPQAARSRVAAIHAASGNGEYGAITCAVKRVGDNAIYALSCRHVFSISEHLHNRNVGKLDVRLHTGSVREQPNGPIFARTVGLRGKLAAIPTVSFDAQLAQVAANRLAQFRATMGGLTFSRVARGRQDIPDRFLILPPGSVVEGGRRRQVRVNAKKLRFAPNRIIPYPGVGPVKHEMLIEAQVTPSTHAGDSGSPAVAVSRTHGVMLLGMHIAGGGGLSYIIPSWQFLAPANYGRPNESWGQINI